MAKFKFSLQNVLKIKAQVEEMHKNNLSKATQQYFEQKNVISNIENDILRTVKMIENKEKERINVWQMKMHFDYINRLREVKEEQTKKLKIYEDEMNECRNKLIEAVKERKMFESLKEKEFSNFKHEQEKKEEQIIDGLVSFKYSQ